MSHSYHVMGLTRGFLRRDVVAIFLGVATLVVPASAATDIRVSKKGVVKATPEHVLAVLSSNEICDKGCRYYGPHIAQEVKLAHKASSNDFFKWTHVSGIKTVKFFKHFTVSRGDVLKIHVRTLAEGKDDALIQDLEEKTGKEHAPLFEVSYATYLVRSKGDQVEIEVEAMTRIGGLLNLLSGTVRKETEKALDAMFENFAR